MNGSSVQGATRELPLKSIQTENCSATVYEGLSPVTDMANRTGHWLEKNETEIAIKWIHVRNGFKPCYLLPRQQKETHLLLRLTIDKNNGWPRSVSSMQHMTKPMNTFLFENNCAFRKPPQE